jgi:hypothetical protein
LSSEIYYKMEVSSSLKSVRLPLFSGVRKDFHTWWIRFVAFANMSNFLEALKKGGEASIPSSDSVVIDITTDAGKMVAAAKKRNALAMANLTMAFQTENLFGIIYKTMSTDWPAGLAHEVVVQLSNKYSPDDRISRVEFRIMLNGVSMKDAEDPSIIFEQVIAIQDRYDTDTHHIEEEELIAVDMGAAPEKYLSVITCEQRVKGDQMSLHDLLSV